MARGCRKNYQEDLSILHNLSIKGRPPDGPSIIPVKWNLPPSGWTKVNIDGVARGSPGKAGCGGIFRTCRWFIKGCFSLILGIRLAFEAKVMGFILAIEFAYKSKWKNLWVETDSHTLWLFLKIQRSLCHGNFVTDGQELSDMRTSWSCMFLTFFGKAMKQKTNWLLGRQPLN